MSRTAPLSGFPEWTPQQRIIERHILDVLRGEFELHGFAEIETRAVEPVSRLAGDSEAAKEIYALRRLNSDGAEKSKLGLHFDLTVPFARYVEEFQGQLQFPFRRYQVQKVWRGERPQDGRFREFYQADIDVVGRETLPLHVDVEVAAVMASALSKLPIPPVRMHVNNRKLVEGFYTGVGVEDVAGALRSVDKLAKLGPEGVAKEIAGQGVSEDAASAILELAKIRSDDAGFLDAVDDLWETTPKADDHTDAQATLAAGLTELGALMDGLNAAVPGVAVADLSIARGLEYYTGSVFETFVEGHDGLGSICSGGRYESLVAGGGFPGVGISAGVTRIMSLVVSAGHVTATRAVPTAVLIAVVDETARGQSNFIANRLRERGISAEVAPSAAKFGKQIQFADKRGIPFVWFPGEDGDGEIKDIRSGEQVAADAGAWEPPAGDARPDIQRG